MTRISGWTGRDGEATGVRHNLLSSHSVIASPAHRVGAGFGEFDTPACGFGAGPDSFDVQVALAILHYCHVHPASPPRLFPGRLYRQADHYRCELVQVPTHARSLDQERSQGAVSVRPPFRVFITVL